MDDQQKPVSDLVYGCRISADHNGSMLVAKFDLANRCKTFHIPSAIAHFLMANISTVEENFGSCALPEIIPNDWDAAIIPTVTGVTVTECSDGLILKFMLNRGSTDGLMLNRPNWCLFMKSLWQYQSHLKLPQSASGAPN